MNKEAGTNLLTFGMINKIFFSQLDKIRYVDSHLNGFININDDKIIIRIVDSCTCNSIVGKIKFIDNKISDDIMMKKIWFMYEKLSLLNIDKIGKNKNVNLHLI